MIRDFKFVIKDEGHKVYFHKTRYDEKLIIRGFLFSPRLNEAFCFATIWAAEKTINDINNKQKKYGSPKLNLRVYKKSEKTGGKIEPRREDDS